MFLGVLDQDTTDQGTGLFTTSAVTTVQNAADFLISSLQTDGVPLMVYSRKLNSAQPVTVTQARAQPAVMRSRRTS
jgi:hypothetical protein